jgi:hypothetical protein
MQDAYFVCHHFEQSAAAFAPTCLEQDLADLQPRQFVLVG